MLETCEDCGKDLSNEKHSHFLCEACQKEYDLRIKRVFDKHRKDFEEDVAMGLVSR